jgi:hypothetical protein
LSTALRSLCRTHLKDQAASLLPLEMAGCCIRMRDIYGRVTDAGLQAANSRPDERRYSARCSKRVTGPEQAL